MSSVITPLLVTVEQASEILQVSDRTVFTLIDSGQLSSVKIGSSRRISLDDLRRVAAEGADLPTVVERKAARANQAVA
jgi:excisionase family DNA binding protein